MKQEIEQILESSLKSSKKTYITLEEIEERLDKKIEYIELVNIIRNFISDGILQAVRKE